MRYLRLGTSAVGLLLVTSLACRSSDDSTASAPTDDAGGTTAPPTGTGNGNVDGSVPGTVDGGADADAGPPPRSTVVPTVRREPVVDLGGVVWDLAFLPDGAALVTMRSGVIRKIAPGATTSTIVANAASTGNPLANLFVQGQSGLMGIAVDPAFAQNRRIYVYFSHDQGGTKDNRVVRYTLSQNDTLEGRTDIVTGISFKANATASGGAGAHSGGRLRFGPDGLLYLTTGDNHSATIPQDLEALGSKVLRFTTDGAPAPNNPSLGSRNLIWALGFRNPQGIAFHPWTGDVFISEHGPGQDDEVTKLVAGANGGWNPNDNGTYNGYSGALMTDTTAVPTAVPPIWKQADSDGISACTFLRGESWKAWRDRLAVAFLAGRKIVVLDFDANLSSVADQTTFPTIPERVRSVVVGPDESLWVTADEGDVFRLIPE